MIITRCFSSYMLMHGVSDFSLLVFFIFILLLRPDLPSVFCVVVVVVYRPEDYAVKELIFQEEKEVSNGVGRGGHCLPNI